MNTLRRVEEMTESIKKLLEKPTRNPCKFCNKKHLEYCCNEQLEFYKRLIKNNLR